MYDQQAAGVALAAGLIQQQASESEHEHDDKTVYSDSELESHEETEFSDSEPEQELVDLYSEPEGREDSDSGFEEDELDELEGEEEDQSEGEPEPVLPQHQVQSGTAKRCLECGTAGQ